MSFFVSKDLEGLVDENCLIPSEESDTLNKEFILEFDKYVCYIKELNFKKSDLKPKLEISFNCNVHTVDVLFKKLGGSASVRIKNTILSVEDLTIDNIFKEEDDNYIVRLTAIYELKG